MANYLTQNDLDSYGPELIDITQRAAMHAVAPHLQHLEQQNVELQRRLAIEARRNMDAAVERQIPNFREVDRDANWHRYLLEPHPLSGRPRQQWLNDAMAAGDANRVISFFREFMRGAGSTQAPAASSSRARPSSGKPTYTPELIGRLYEAHRKGAYVGREQEWSRQEADIFAAQREGRVQQVYLTK
jgi:hypothetical protein